MDIKNNNLFFTDGDQWESFCHSCLKYRHQKDNYKPVNAISYKPIDEKDKGDYGIDGFTATGIAYQCYLPDSNYSQKELYTHLYNKIRTDIFKLEEYKDKLILLFNGIKIKIWNFTTPEIVYSTDFHRLVNSYENSIKSLNIPFIDNDFKIGFVDLDNLKLETAIYFKSNSVGLNFETIIPDNETIAEYKNKNENNYLVNNAIRKNTELFPKNGKDYTSNIIEKTDATIEDYLVGEIIQNQWFETIDTEYERFLELKRTLERRIKNESKVPFEDKNRKIAEIRDLIVDKLGKEFPILLNEAGKEELASSIIAEWLLNCSLDFI